MARWDCLAARESMAAGKSTRRWHPWLASGYECDHAKSPFTLDERALRFALQMIATLPSSPSGGVDIFNHHNMTRVNALKTVIIGLEIDHRAILGPMHEVWIAHPINPTVRRAEVVRDKLRSIQPQINSCTMTTLPSKPSKLWQI